MNRIKLGIRQRVLIITLVPLVIITLILGSYFIKAQLDDAHNSLIEKGQALSQMMATTSEFGLLTGNREILSGLIRSAIQSQEITDVVFLDPEFRTIIRSQKGAQPLDKAAGYPYFHNGNAYFLHPVIATGFDVMDSPELLDHEAEPEFLGWVVMILSDDHTKARQQDILIRGILLALAGLLTTLLLALRFGRKITNPILGLTHVIEMLQRGHLETRANVSSTGELKLLAQGINRLAHRVQESNLDLEGRVDKATQRLRATLVHLEKQNQALDRARKRADNANRAKDEFLARMSHELRTPLTSVSGFARLLEQTDLKLEQKEYTRIINLTSGLLLSIIDDILDYSKLESNAVELEAIPFDLERCIYDVLEMQTATAHDKGIELIPIIAPETPRYIIGDPVRMRQVLTNLIGNAVKFTSSGYVAVSVNAHNISNLASNIKIAVEDTGCGIPEEQLKNLFKAFSQADTSITRTHGGSGLGLVIAKRLTELMSGRISLNSKLQQGTCISLEIPFTTSPQKRHGGRKHLKQLYIYDQQSIIAEGLCAQLQHAVEDIKILQDLEQLPTDESAKIIYGLPAGDASQEQINELIHLQETFAGRIILLSSSPLPAVISSRIVQLRKPPRTQLLLNALSPETYRLPDSEKPVTSELNRKSRILVAEDNDFNRLLLGKILDSAGVESIEAVNGEEAVLKAAQARPDIILMDVHMPLMDGIEATCRIRMSDSKTPIIALTANVISSEHDKLRDAGINEILLKPINDKELCSTLDRYIGKTQSATDITPSEEENTLDRYDIDRETLKCELMKQLEGIESGFCSKDIAKMRNHSHQLQGLCGLYELPELEAGANTLHDALKEGGMRGIWKEYWQLKRIIEHEQF